MNPQDLSSILAAYSKATGREASIVHYEYSVGKFAAWGFTADDMTLVCEHIKRENRKRGHEYQMSLKLSPLLADSERFADLLSEAKALNRNRRPAPSPREQVLQAFRPVMAEQVGSTTVTTPAMSSVVKAIQGVK